MIYGEGFAQIKRSRNKREILLDQDVITIGRKADNDIAIDNQAVSGYHARIKSEGHSLCIEDANSLNGT